MGVRSGEVTLLICACALTRPSSTASTVVGFGADDAKTRDGVHGSLSQPLRVLSTRIDKLAFCVSLLPFVFVVFLLSFLSWLASSTCSLVQAARLLTCRRPPPSLAPAASLVFFASTFHRIVDDYDDGDGDGDDDRPAMVLRRVPAGAVAMRRTAALVTLVAVILTAMSAPAALAAPAQASPYLQATRRRRARAHANPAPEFDVLAAGAPPIPADEGRACPEGADYEELVAAAQDVGRAEQPAAQTPSFTFSVLFHDTPEKVSEALELFTCAVRADPSRAGAWRWRGVMYSELQPGSSTSRSQWVPRTAEELEEQVLRNFRYARQLAPEDLDNYYLPILYMYVAAAFLTTQKQRQMQMQRLKLRLKLKLKLMLQLMLE